MALTKSWLNYYSFVFPLAVGWLYTFWTWIFVYAGIWDWPYGFFNSVLNPNNKPAWITVVAILAGSLVIIVIFFIAYATFRIREYYGKKRETKEVIPPGKINDEANEVVPAEEIHDEAKQVVPAEEITGENQA
jgi:phosphotransferase system  glucose/maltose/N-acetylglucosamine-specific IIC component